MIRLAVSQLSFVNIDYYDCMYFTECSHYLVANDSSNHIPLVIFNTNNSNSTSLMAGDRNIHRMTLLHFNGTNQLIERSSCQIVSLEVYRGKEQAFQINHHGFSLTDNGAIEVHGYLFYI